MLRHLLTAAVTTAIVGGAGYYDVQLKDKQIAAVTLERDAAQKAADTRKAAIDKAIVDLKAAL
jgi:Glu-tRNA(Gln) amidotransferase subunit E-like FAD-binding protein